MLFRENVMLALRGLWANKMRALLTMLGIIIGIGSVIAIMTVANSMTNAISVSMQSMGASNITLSLTQKSEGDFVQGGSVRLFRSSSYGEEDLITDEMIEQYREAYDDSIYAISLSESLGSFTVETGGAEASVNASGVNLDYQKAQDLQLSQGHWLLQRDLDVGSQVAVVSDEFCDQLSLTGDPLGQSFELTSGNKVYTFYIVGVYPYEDNGMVLTTTDEEPTTDIYIPLSTAKSINRSDEGYSQLTVVPNTDVDAQSLLDQSETFFAKFYASNDSFTVTASSMESMMEAMTEMLSTIGVAVAVIAGISLVVGGIGVMNIMLVSITERTREIGTRKALGATNGSIRVQFIIESVVICIIGGVLGIAVGVGLGAIGARILGYAAAPSLGVIALAVTFSGAIGVFFGYYPANKAARLDPIEALRYE